MSKFLPFILAVVILLLIASATGFGEAPMRGEDMAFRLNAIAFATENRALLDGIIDHMEQLDPTPRQVLLEDGLFFQRLTADFGGPEYVPFEDEYLENILQTTLLEGVSREDVGWVFYLDNTEGFLDTGHYYDLLYRIANPVSEGDWTTRGNGFERHGHRVEEYVEPLGGGLYYSYTLWY